MKLFAMKLRCLVCAFLGFLLFGTQSNAQVVIPTSINVGDNHIEAKLTLHPLTELDLKIEFNNSVGLTTDSIVITAERIDPTDVTVTNRLPSALTGAIASFPVLISISPKPNAGFAFEGPAMVELYTKAIHFDPDVPLRLFTSHNNGLFEDITTLTSSGSFRARGSTGRFSDFIVALDTRNPASVIDEKANNVRNTLAANQPNINAALFTTLEANVSSIIQAISNVDYAGAMLLVDEAISVTENANGAHLPNVWRSSGDITNVQGELLTQLKTLRYSLRIL